MLKKLIAAFAAVSLLLLAACDSGHKGELTTSSTNDNGSWSINEPDVTKVARDDDKWPIGDCTEGIPKPGFGKIIIVGEDNIGSDDSVVTVIITEVSENNFDNYCRQLRIARFNELDGFEGEAENPYYFFGVNDDGKKIETEFVISPNDASGRMRIKIYK